MAVGESMQSNLSFRLTQSITTSTADGDTFTISNDLERDLPITSTQSSIVLKNKKGTIRERMQVDINAGTVTILKRGLDQSESKVENAALKKDWDTGTLGYITVLASDLLDIDKTGYGVNISTDINFYGANQHFGTNTFKQDVEIEGDLIVSSGALTVPSLTTAQRLALIPTNGMIVYDSTIGENYQYISGNRVAVSAGSTQPNASEIVAGKIELATNAEMGTGASTGGTGARLVMPNDQLVKTSSGAGDENKVAVLNSSGQFAAGFINMSANDPTIYGTGADGALSVPSGTTIITPGIKNYSSINVASGATLQIKGSGGVILKSTGNVTIEGTVDARYAFPGSAMYDDKTLLYLNSKYGLALPAGNTGGAGGALGIAGGKGGDSGTGSGTGAAGIGGAIGSVGTAGGDNTTGGGGGGGGGGSSTTTGSNGIAASGDNGGAGGAGGAATGGTAGGGGGGGAGYNTGNGGAGGAGGANAELNGLGGTGGNGGNSGINGGNGGAGGVGGASTAGGGGAGNGGQGGNGGYGYTEGGVGGAGGVTASNDGTERAGTGGAGGDSLILGGAGGAGAANAAGAGGGDGGAGGRGYTGGAGGAGGNGSGSGVSGSGGKGGAAIGASYVLITCGGTLAFSGAINSAGGTGGAGGNGATGGTGGGVNGNGGDGGNGGDVAIIANTITTNTGTVTNTAGAGGAKGTGGTGGADGAAGSAGRTLIGTAQSIF